MKLRITNKIGCPRKGGIFDYQDWSLVWNLLYSFFLFAGETKCEIKFINIQEKNKEGYYVCKISVASPFYSPMEKLSAGAMLTVKVPSVNDNAQYNRKCCRTAVS